MHHFYFISIIPPNPIKNQIQKLQKGFQLRFSEGSKLDTTPHITLLHPFQISEKKEEVLIKQLQGFFGNIEPIDIQLNDFSNFATSVIYIDVNSQELSSINNQLVNFAYENSDIIFKNSENSYEAHITIAKNLESSIFSKAFKFYENKYLNFHFTARKIWLLKYNGGKWETIEDFIFNG